MFFLSSQLSLEPKSVSFSDFPNLVKWHLILRIRIIPLATRLIGGNDRFWTRTVQRTQTLARSRENRGKIPFNAIVHKEKHQARKQKSTDISDRQTEKMRKKIIKENRKERKWEKEENYRNEKRETNRSTRFVEGDRSGFSNWENSGRKG